MRLRVMACTVLFLVSGVAAYADTFTYTVTVAGYLASLEGTFSFTEPLLLTSDTIISTGITSSGPSVSDIVIDPIDQSCSIGVTSFPGACFEVDYPGGVDKFGETFATQLTGPGSYGGGALVITDAASPAPEPSSLALLSTGILGFAGIVRRRFVA